MNTGVEDLDVEYALQTGLHRQYRCKTLVADGPQGDLFLCEKRVYKSGLKDLIVLNECVVKKTRNMMGENGGFRSEMLREVSVLKTMSENGFIVGANNIYFDANVIYIEFDKFDANLGDFVNEMFKDNNVSSLNYIKKFAYQLLDGVSYMHERKIMHRDLNPQNIWIDISHGGNIKIAGFGFAREELPNIDGANEHTQKVGELCYQAPEVLLGITQYGLKVDNWAVGGIIGYMARKGVDMFESDCEMGVLVEICKTLGTPTANTWQNAAKEIEILPMCRKVAMETILPIFNDLNEARGVNLVEKLLRVNPAQRASCGELKGHSWFNDLNISKLMKNNNNNSNIVKKKEHKKCVCPKLKFDTNDENTMNERRDKLHQNSFTNLFANSFSKSFKNSNVLMSGKRSRKEHECMDSVDCDIEMNNETLPSMQSDNRDSENEDIAPPANKRRRLNEKKL